MTNIYEQLAHVCHHQHKAIVPVTVTQTTSNAPDVTSTDSSLNHQNLLCLPTSLPQVDANIIKGKHADFNSWSLLLYNDHFLITKCQFIALQRKSLSPKESQLKTKTIILSTKNRSISLDLSITVHLTFSAAYFYVYYCRLFVHCCCLLVHYCRLFLLN